MVNQARSPKDRLIFALDFTSFEKAEPYIRELKDHIGLFKIGKMLVLAEGLAVISKIQEITGGHKVFIDLKFGKDEDIPLHIESISSLLLSKPKEIEFISFHIQENNGDFLRKMVEKLQNGIKILGITVLTSEVEGAGVSTVPLKERVIERAKMAKSAGCAGVVCSGQEAREVRKVYGPEFIIVTPGIRPEWANVPEDDQRRIMTPKEAIVNGADYIVVGRPITIAKDHVNAAQKIPCAPL